MTDDNDLRRAIRQALRPLWLDGDDLRLLDEAEAAVWEVVSVRMARIRNATR